MHVEDHVKDLADLDAGKRSASSLSLEAGRRTSHGVWRLMQRGLVYPAPFAIFATFWLKDQRMTRMDLSHVLRDAREHIHKHLGSSNTTAVAGVDFAVWKRWCAADGIPVPAGMRFAFPADRDGNHSAVFGRSHGTFVDSHADLWFHVKSDEAENVRGLFHWLQERLAAFCDPARIVHQFASSRARTAESPGGKVVGARFSENLNNPADPVTIQEHALVGYEDPVHLGASYVLAQRLAIHWEQVLQLSPEGIEDLVGRTDKDVIIPSKDTRTHIKSSRVQDDTGNSRFVMRLGLPFGSSPAVTNDELRSKGANLRDEQGIYFAGFCKEAAILERIMDSQVGTSGFLRDRLLSMMQGDLGGIFYIPSRIDLSLELEQTPSFDALNWRRFPGVDWDRVSRHFTAASVNGYMHYSHQEYLYRMATMSAADREKYQPPSHRVLRILSSVFTLWQDSWYFDRKQQEMAHLSVYLERRFGKPEADRVMGLSVVERMGWAVRMAIGDVFVSKDYGFRGRHQDGSGNWINGADTYSLHPLEHIVGQLPRIGIGQGRYMIDYARADERLPQFFAGLSYASAVGHVVPDHAAVLRHGLGALKADVAARAAATGDAQKKQFYQGVGLALEGVSEHLRAFARLAAETARSLPGGMKAERDNLTQVEARLTWLADEPPRSFIEATQLLFTLHTCLHLIGEVTSIGRIDQLLWPFYEADVAAGTLTPELAQEILDCFWIKVGEKVQINRLYLEDHQPAGNLAMGGMSGNYPQGSSNNQWIQQVTIGGTVADDSPGAGTPAYNKLTLLALRCARRLPLNAPCLSLRVRPDIPAELLEEAACTLLAGGAHPILLHDDKIIPGLVASGEQIGDGEAPSDSTPVATKAKGLWNSHVALSHARDYSCDGCYEPQLTGRNWFTLGGFTTLQSLEAALNRGKTWASAGPLWFRGQRASFSSCAVEEIRSYEQLEALFFEHLHFMYAKQVDGLIGIFGQMAAICPSPLLSALTDGCLDKGLDIYGGGARYNVVTPCFTGLSTLINSLWAIRAMVFDPETACTSLPELVEALICDWGYKMVEPFISPLMGEARIDARAERFKRLREVAMRLPRFGRGHTAIDQFGDRILHGVADVAVAIFTRPAASTAKSMLRLAQTLGTPEHPFGGFQIQPGVGTFENYLDWGAMEGASADGRRLGDPIASDLSPAPSFGDLPIDEQPASFLASLQGFAGKGVEAFWDTAPVDFSIREDFPKDALVAVLAAFARGEGSNLITITVADQATFEGAAKDTEQYDLLRARMGGWTEFVIAMFPGHQSQHQRRPVSTPDPAPAR